MGSSEQHLDEQQQHQAGATAQPRGSGLSTGRWALGVTSPPGIPPSPSSSEPRDASASEAAMCSCCLMFLSGNLGVQMSLLPCGLHSLSHTCTFADMPGGARLCCFACQGVCHWCPVSVNLRLGAPALARARVCKVLMGWCLFSAGSASPQRQVPPRKNPVGPAQRLCWPPRAGGLRFSQESRQLYFHSISRHSAAAGRACGRRSLRSPGEHQQIQPGCRDSGNRETGMNTAPLWCRTRDPRGPGPQRPSCPNKLRLRSSCRDQPWGQRVPDKCTINTATAA